MKTLFSLFILLLCLTSNAEITLQRNPNGESNTTNASARLPIVIKDILGKKYPFSVRTSTTVAQLKHKIMEELKMDVSGNAITLIFGATRLEDGQDLRHYNMKPGSVILMLAPPSNAESEVGDDCEDLTGWWQRPDQTPGHRGETEFIEFTQSGCSGQYESSTNFGKWKDYTINAAGVIVSADLNGGLIDEVIMSNDGTELKRTHVFGLESEIAHSVEIAVGAKAHTAIGSGDDCRDEYSNVQCNLIKESGGCYNGGHICRKTCGVCTSTDAAVGTEDIEKTNLDAWDVGYGVLFLFGMGFGTFLMNICGKKKRKGEEDNRLLES